MPPQMRVILIYNEIIQHDPLTNKAIHDCLCLPPNL